MREPKPQSSPTQVCVAVLLLGGLLWIVYAATQVNSPTSRQSAPQATTPTPAEPPLPAKTGPPGDQVDAFLMAQDFVTARLVAPSTASHPWSPNSKGVSVVPLSNNLYWGVNSYVDSQNGFGAMIRTKYTAIVHCTGGDKWELIGLETDP